MSVEYIVHEHPVGRSNSNYLAMADLGPFGFEQSMEQIWLTPLSGGKYKVACIPFRVYGMALNDVVGLDSERKRIVYVLECSGHRVFRIFWPSALTAEKVEETRLSVISAIAGDNLKAEWSGDRHVAIDLPEGSGIGRVWRVIEEDAATDSIFWEWGDIEDFSS